jgi:hypothetical protein
MLHRLGADGRQVEQTGTCSSAPKPSAPQWPTYLPTLASSSADNALTRNQSRRSGDRHLIHSQEVRWLGGAAHKRLTACKMKRRACARMILAATRGSSRSILGGKRPGQASIPPTIEQGGYARPSRLRARGRGPGPTCVDSDASVCGFCAHKRESVRQGAQQRSGRCGLDLDLRGGTYPTLDRAPLRRWLGVLAVASSPTGRETGDSCPGDLGMGDVVRGRPEDRHGMMPLVSETPTAVRGEPA